MTEPRTPDPRLAQSSTIQTLREGPVPAGEVEPSFEQREYVRKLRLPRSCPSGKHGSGRTGSKMVYYLYGDERRAVRKLIEERTEWFEGVLGGGYNDLTALSSGWDDALVTLAVEEWEFRKHEQESESDH